MLTQGLSLWNIINLPRSQAPTISLAKLEPSAIPGPKSLGGSCDADDRLISDEGIVYRVLRIVVEVS